jgi:hypothetical protein
MRIMHHFFWQNDLKKNEGSLYTFLKEYFFVAVKNLRLNEALMLNLHNVLF